MSTINQSVLYSFMSIRTKLARYVSRLVPPADVEDIVQDTYIRLCSIEDKTSDKYNQSFLYTVAKNLAFDHLKRAEFKLADGVDDEAQFHSEDSDTTFDRAATQERFAAFCDAVKSMPKQCRKVFVLRKVYGFSQQEIAEHLGISINTVSNHLVNGMKLFKHLSMSKPLLSVNDSPIQAKKGG